MDHMRISGTEPSSVILSQTKLFKKLKVMPKKCQIKLKPNEIDIHVILKKMAVVYMSAV